MEKTTMKTFILLTTIFTAIGSINAAYCTQSPCTSCEKLTQDELQQCKEIAKFLIDNFAYSKEQTGNKVDINEETGVISCVSHSTLQQIINKANSKKVVTIASKIPSHTDIEKGDTINGITKEKIKEIENNFDQNYVRIFTLGYGLCPLYALGLNSFNYFYRIKTKCKLQDVYINVISEQYDDQNINQTMHNNIISMKNMLNDKAITEKDYDKSITQIKNAYKTFKAIIKELKKIDVLEQSDKIELCSDNQTSKELSEIFKKFEELVKDIELEFLDDYMWDPDYFGNEDTKYMNILHSLIVTYKQAPKLYNKGGYLSNQDISKLYIEYSKNKNRKICVFGNNPYDNEIFKFGKWICYNNGQKPREATDNDIALANDLIVFNNGHLNRVVPKKLLECIKQEIKKQEGILLLEAEEFADDTSTVKKI